LEKSCFLSSKDNVQQSKFEEKNGEKTPTHFKRQNENGLILLKTDFNRNYGTPL